MNLKFIGLFTTICLLFGNIYSSNYIIKKDGTENECSVVTDNNDNEILFANTEDGPVLIPFSELERLEVLEQEGSSYTLKVTYKDKSNEIVKVDNSLSLMCKNGVGRVSLSEVAYVSFLQKDAVAELSVAAEVTERIETTEPMEETDVVTAPITTIETVNVDSVEQVASEVVGEEVVTGESVIEEVDSNIVVATVENRELEVAVPIVEEKMIETVEVEEEFVEETISEETVVNQLVQNNTESASYLVKRFDTLWDLAARYYNDPYKWQVIWKDNESIDNPDLIYPGDMLHIDNIYTDKTSIAYNENMANNKMGLNDRAVAFDTKQASLFGMRTVSMFKKEHLEDKEEEIIDTTVVDGAGSNLFEIIENERYNMIFSYGYFSKLGEIVPVGYKGEGKVYSRSEDDKVFIKYYSTVRIDLGHNKDVKVDDNYSVGVVTRYFGQGLIKNDDRIYKKMEVKVPRLKKLILEKEDISCRVVGPVRQMGRAITQAGDQFIVDAGKSHDLKVGHVFEVYTKKKDGYTDLPVAEVYVVKLFDDYAIIQLDARWEDTKIQKGDFLQHKLTFEVYYP